MAIKIGVARLPVKSLKITKTMDEQRLVFGFFNVLEINNETIYDYEDDAFDPGAFEKAVYKYVENHSVADEQHNEQPIGKIVESMFFSKEKQEALGLNLGGVAWWGGFHITDENAWNRIKAGDYEMFSIGGRGKYAVSE